MVRLIHPHMNWSLPKYDLRFVNNMVFLWTIFCHAFYELSSGWPRRRWCKSGVLLQTTLPSHRMNCRHVFSYHLPLWKSGGPPSFTPFIISLRQCSRDLISNPFPSRSCKWQSVQELLFTIIVKCLPNRKEERCFFKIASLMLHKRVRDTIVVECAINQM